MEATDEMIAMARRIAEKVARRLHVGNDQRTVDDFESVALAATSETTELAAAYISQARQIDGYLGVHGPEPAYAGALRSNVHLKGPDNAQ